MMTRKQIVEVLSNNLEMYRDDPHFVPYFVELALYLLENQYDATADAEEASARVTPTRGGDAALVRPLARTQFVTKRVKNRLERIGQPMQTLETEDGQWP